MKIKVLKQTKQADFILEKLDRMLGASEGIFPHPLCDTLAGVILKKQRFGHIIADPEARGSFKGLLYSASSIFFSPSPPPSLTIAAETFTVKESI